MSVLSMIYLERRRHMIEDRIWNTFVNLYVDTYRGEFIRLADWARLFVKRGLIPFLRRQGFTLQNENSYYIERKLLYWLYAIEWGHSSLPPVKHRNLPKDRWIFESTIPDKRWSALFQYWGIYGVFENDGYVRESFPEFVYTYLNPEESHRIIHDDNKEKHAIEEEDERSATSHADGEDL